jgi:hypothetical protein
MWQRQPLGFWQYSLRGIIVLTVIIALIADQWRRRTPSERQLFWEIITWQTK